MSLVPVVRIITARHLKIIVSMRGWLVDESFRMLSCNEQVGIFTIPLLETGTLKHEMWSSTTSQKLFAGTETYCNDNHGLLTSILAMHVTAGMRFSAHAMCIRNFDRCQLIWDTECCTRAHGEPHIAREGALKWRTHKRTHERRVASQKRSCGLLSASRCRYINIQKKNGGGVNRIRIRNNCIYFATSHRNTTPEGIQKEISPRWCRRPSLSSSSLS